VEIQTASAGNLLPVPDRWFRIFAFDPSSVLLFVVVISALPACPGFSIRGEQVREKNKAFVFIDVSVLLLWLGKSNIHFRYDIAPRGFSEKINSGGRQLFLYDRQRAR
jgi:hypothetical protein